MDPIFDAEQTMVVDEENLEASARERLLVWTGALKLMMDEPWFGTGYGLFPRRIGE